MDFKKSGRYAVPSDEDFEPDSNQEVLKNKLGIKSKDEIEILEESELERTESELLNEVDEDQQFTAEYICAIHELWLGDIYPFAGKYRTVNMSKANFIFAPADRIEFLMAELESKYLAKYTPCHYTDNDQLAFALGIVHIEFIVIHPFREGNGRVARLLADLMAMQSKKAPLNYSAIDQTENPEGFDQYILAIHAGHGGNYEPIKKVFKMLLEQSV
ncbi:Adenosine monophosphate-protein transferase VbhT [Aquicella siphonis]|uniref:protein adenylyltransferase n=1 Tax=Aquicella siphonis TaxID=254247 RepID=A0A5E4PDW8_9COXI|nr:Fic family protein [Aquicella siphonis]VVC74994.1 Adenosine monophosphate-protein transferase VbhT [Aquicella siphonis]